MELCSSTVRNSKVPDKATAICRAMSDMSGGIHLDRGIFMALPIQVYHHTHDFILGHSSFMYQGLHQN